MTHRVCTARGARLAARAWLLTSLFGVAVYSCAPSLNPANPANPANPGDPAALSPMAAHDELSRAPGTVAPGAPPRAPSIDPARLALFQALPDAMQAPGVLVTPAKVELGRLLYFDARLSRAGDVSCNTCHDLKNYGVDGKPRSGGNPKHPGRRNSPSVYHAAGHLAQFWDGRATEVETQVLAHGAEMPMKDAKAVEKLLGAIPGYARAFKMAFRDEKRPVRFENIGRAIGSFERKLVTPSRFDKFLDGEANALTPEELTGFNVFVDAGCVSCHSGAYVGGSTFQKLGAVKPWPASGDPGAGPSVSAPQPDRGRGGVSKKPDEDGFFKVPSLRNVARTGPYFHDGSVADLGVAVKMMAAHQLGRDLSPEQTRSIVAFLGALTGTLPDEYIAEPASLQRTAR